MNKHDKKEETLTKSSQKYLIICERKENGLDVMINSDVTSHELDAILESILKYQSENYGQSKAKIH